MNHQAEVEIQKAQGKAKVRHQEEVEEALRQEQNEELESGDFDQWDVRARRDQELTDVNSPDREIPNVL